MAQFVAELDLIVAGSFAAPAAVVATVVAELAFATSEVDVERPWSAVAVASFVTVPVVVLTEADQLLLSCAVVACAVDLSVVTAVAGQALACLQLA